MPITLPVAATADDQAFKRIADRYEKWGSDTGKKVGSEMAKSMGDALEKADTKSADKFERAYGKVADAIGKVRVEEAKLQDLRSKGASDTRIIAQAEALERARRAEAAATRDAAQAYSELHTSTTRLSSATSMLSESLSGTRFGQLAVQTEQLAAGFGRVGFAVGGAVTAFAGIAVNTVAATKALYDLGARWDSVADGITARTGKVGDELDAVMDQVGKVAAATAEPIEAIGDVAAQVSQAMHLTGDDLGAMTQQLANLNALTGENTNVKELARLYRVFGTAAADQPKILDELYTANTTTGVSVNDLIGTLVKAGPTIKQFGLDVGSAASVMATFEQAGIDPEKAVAALTVALKKFAAANRDPQEALRQTITDIKNLADAGRDVEALNLAQSSFGKGFAPVFDAIKSGTLDLQALDSQFGSNTRSINETRGATEDLAEHWQKFTNNLQTGFKPIADEVFGSMNEWLSSLLDKSGQLALKIGELFQGAEPFQSPNDPGFASGSDALGVLLGVPGADGPKPGDPGFIGPVLPGDAPQVAGVTPGVAQPSRVGEGAGGLRAPAAGWGFAPNTKSGIGGGGKAGAAQVPYGAVPGIAAGVPVTDAVYSAQSSLWEAQHSTEEKRARLQQLEADNTAKAEELVAARNDVAKAERDQHAAEMRFAAAQKSAYDAQFKQLQQTSEQFAGISAQLDQDFGVSQGLPGIAENITKFLGSLAFAPVVGALQGVQAGLGFKPGEAGSGVFGMVGSALGMASPRQPGGQAIGGGGGSMPVGAPAFAALPGESAAGFAHRAMMPYWQSQGLEVGDHAADQFGEHQNGALDIMVPSIEAGNAVLQQVLSDPNVYGAIFNNQTYGYGHGPTPQDYAAGHTGDPNQDHTNHVHAWYKPGDPNNINPNGAPIGMGPGGVSVSGSGATPVFVVNMPGSGLGGPTAGSQGPGKAALPAGAGNLWDQVAQAESSGNWQDNNSGGHTTSSGAPRGGLQITDGTWGEFGGGEFAPTANLATREQQQEIANRIAFGGYNGKPPQGLGAWQAIADGRVPGVTTATPASAFGVGGGPGLPGPAVAPTPGIISAAPPLPSGIPGIGPAPGGGGGIGPGTGFPGLGGPPAGLPGMGAFSGPSSDKGGREFGAGTPASGGLGLGGGLIGMAGGAVQSAIGAAGLAADAAGGGGGGSAGAAVLSAAAQIGIQEGMRAISYAGQLAGIGVSGLMETFSLNDSALADPGKSWLGRVAMGVAGARPALPNSAGGKGGQQNDAMAESGKTGPNEPPGPMDPNQLQNGGQGGPGSEGKSGSGGNTINNTTNVTVQGDSQSAYYTGATVADAASEAQLNMTGR